MSKDRTIPFISALVVLNDILKNGKWSVYLLTSRDIIIGDNMTNNCIRHRNTQENKYLIYLTCQVSPGSAAVTINPYISKP